MENIDCQNGELEQVYCPSPEPEILHRNSKRRDVYDVLYDKDGVKLLVCRNRRLEQYRVKKGTKTICNGAFASCNRLTRVTIPESVKIIGEYAFAYTGITRLPKLNGVTSIYDGTFTGCEGLASATIPDTITSIENSAFSSCPSLKRVSIGDGVTKVGNHAFAYCTALANLTIGSAVTVIEEMAFNGCKSLKKLIIPDSVTEIGFRAFADCPAMSQLTIGRSVTKIRNMTFEDCSKLKVIYSRSATPPDIQQTFSDADKKKCVVYVPVGSLDLYRASKCWAVFPDIREMDFETVE